MVKAAPVTKVPVMFKCSFTETTEKDTKNELVETKF